MDEKALLLAAAWYLVQCPENVGFQVCGKLYVARLAAQMSSNCSFSPIAPNQCLNEKATFSKNPAQIEENYF